METARKFCPKCNSSNVIIDGSLVKAFNGAMICQDCGYKDTVFPEKRINKTKLTRSNNG